MNIKSSSSIANFSVGDFTVIASRNLITKDSDETSITPKMLSVLTELAKHPGETLSKEHLIIEVWGSIHTSDMVLSRAISDLRKVFGDSAKTQRHIETVTKQGYRLKQPVKWHHSSHDSKVQPPSEPPLTPQSHSISKPKPALLQLANKHKLLTLAALMFVFLTIGYWFKSDKLTNPAPAMNSQPKQVQLTANTDTESYIRFSVDGKYLAYATKSETELGRRLKVRSLVNNKVISVGALPDSKDDSYDLAPVFSPDGKEVAYKHLTMEGCHIRIFNFSSAQERDLTECPFSKSQGLDWSPDGKQLVTTVFNHIKKIEGLMLIDTNSGQFNILPAPKLSATGHIWPRFSPDGNTLALIYIQPNNNLWTIGLVDIASGEFTEVLPLAEQISQVVWNETGDSLYYLISKGVEAGIWSINLSTKQSLPIAKTESISLDFNQLTKEFAFIKKEEEFSIWKSFQAKNGEVVSEQLLQNLPQSNYPSLSPDNTMLAFISTASGIDSLWIRTLSDNSDVLVLQGKSKEKLSEPTWSPDSKQLLISALSKGSSRVIQFDVELGNSSQFPSQNNVKMAKWSQDGTMMYWYEQIDDTWHIMEKNLASNQQQIILTQPVFRFEIADKMNLHYQKIGTIKVHSRRLAGVTSQTPKDKMLLPLEDYHTWDAHLDAIYYVSHSIKQNKLMLYKKELSSGVSEELYPVESMLTVSGRHLSVSNDGSMAYYTRLDKSGTDIVLMTQN